MYNFIAKDALNDLTENGVSVAEYRLDHAEHYAEAAYLDMGYTSSYNPFDHAPAMARRAAIEYVKAKIMGRDPYSVPTYMNALQVWQKAAALDRHKARPLRIGFKTRLEPE